MGQTGRYRVRKISRGNFPRLIFCWFRKSTAIPVAVPYALGMNRLRLSGYNVLLTRSAARIRRYCHERTFTGIMLSAYDRGLKETGDQRGGFAAAACTGAFAL